MSQAPLQAPLIDINGFTKFAKDQGFVGDKILRQIAIAINTAIASNTVPAILLRGPAGSGKTWISELIAKYLNAEYVFYQATPGSSEDDLLYKYAPSEKSKSGIEVIPGPLPEALKLSQKRRVVLTIDEFDKTRPSTDAILLDFLQNARVSVRINKKRIITGNRQNLIVILTSNDFREFSEPLLRRVVSIFFEPPPPNAVEELFKKKFDEKIAKLLTTIYTASLYAKLSKPVTIQELYQLGNAMLLYPNATIDELLLMFVTKSYDDLYELQRTLEQLRAEELTTSSNSSNEVSVGETLAKKINEMNESQNQQASNQTNNNNNSATTVQQLLSLIKVTKPIINELKPEIVDKSKQIETFAAIEDDDFREYTRVIQAFDPSPSDDPSKFDKFKVVYDELQKKFIITATKPLYLLELISLFNSTDINGEFYISDVIAYDNDESNPMKTLNKRLGSSLYHLYRIFYYTRNLLIFGVNSDVANERAMIIRMQRLVNDDDIFKIDIYINTKVMSKDLRMSVRDFIDYELKYLSITAYMDNAVKKIQQVSVYKDANEFIMKKDEIPYLKSAVEILRRFSRLVTVKIERAENACETARDYKRNKELVRGSLNAKWNRDDMVFTIYLPPCVPDIKALEDLLGLPVVDF